MAWLLRRRKNRRVFVLGWDCADPRLVFDQFKAEMPHTQKLMNQGTYGKLRSAIPCITIPAWSSMTSSRDPGEMGIYGFRNRHDRSYDEMRVADGNAVKVKRVWDYLGEAGRESVVLNVPQTYPLRSIKGHMLSGLLTPGPESAFAYPAIFKQEVLKIAPGYQFDAKQFRTLEKDRLLQEIIDLTEVQHRVLKHCICNKQWDFLMHVNIGVDRMHHAFWRYHDPQHRLHEPDSRFRHAIRDYYRMIDSLLGEVLALLDDDTHIMIVSDHGVSRMDGAICINEWLWENGWLSLNTPPQTGTISPFEAANVNWGQTKAWASGGYYGRIFLNQAEREPQGTIPPAAYEAVRDELAAALKAIPAPDGSALNTTVYKPEEIYKSVQGIAPDLLVYFGDLHWRAVGSLGYGQHYTLENDTGPDDANHAVNGLYLLYDPHGRGKGASQDQQLMDIAPTVLDRLGLLPAASMQGKVISTV